MREAEALYKGMWTFQLIADERYKKLQAKDREIHLLRKNSELVQEELNISRVEVNECKSAYSAVEKQNRRLKTGVSIIGGVVVIESIAIALLMISR